MKEDTTLFNRTLRQSFAWDKLSPAGAKELRQALNEAHRFVLDGDMSKFLGTLACTPFIFEREKREQRDKVMDSILKSARLPHKTLWVELSLIDYKRGVMEAGGPKINFDVKEVPLQEGWLIETHPDDDENFRATLFLSDPKIRNRQSIIVPASIIWTTKENVEPAYWPDPIKYDRSLDFNNVASKVLLGLPEYSTKAVTLSACPFTRLYSPDTAPQLASFFREWSGVQRRILVFLATITDLPIVKKACKPSERKYLAKGQLRAYLDYDMITLNVPERRYTDRTKLARDILLKVHRRAHMVRGHWRHMGTGKKVWVKEHQRGDATLGFVRHGYAVTHRVEQEGEEQ